MAAVAGKDKVWMGSNEGYRSGKTYPEYICSLTKRQLFNRTAAVVASAGLGAAIGAGVGAAVGAPSVVGVPPGAASGAVIGALSGLGVGIAGVMIFDVCKYYEAYEVVKKQGGQAFSEKLSNLDLDPDYLCGINHVPMIEPVRINGEKQLYERKVLQEWIERDGTSPLTRKKITVQNIQFAAEGLAYNGKACHEILQDPVAIAKFTPEEVVALKAYREDCVAVSSRFYKKETTTILKQAASLAVNPRDALAKLSELVELIDPIANLDLDQIGADEGSFSDGEVAENFFLMVAPQEQKE